MSHLDEGILHAMLDGEIGSTELKTIEAHLAGCGACGARLEEARRFRDESLAMIETLDEQPALAGLLAAAAPAPAPMAAPRRPSLAKRLPAWAPGLAWAATIVLAVGLGLSLRTGDLRAPTAGTDALPAPATRVPAEVPAPTTAPERSAPPNEPRRNRRTSKDQAVGGLAKAETSAPDSATRLNTAAATAPATAPSVAAAAPPVAQPEQNDARRSALGARPAAKKSLLAPVAAADELVLRERQDAAGTASITAARAIEFLGGSIRLVDGLTPVRFELNGDVVRVVYETSFGRLILEQWRAANVVSHRLVAPRSAPADSVSAWAERVR